MLAEAALVLTFAGLGPVEIGMSPRRAERVSGLDIRLTEVTRGCFQGPIGPRRLGAFVLVRHGRVRTAKGLRVGDSRRRLRRRYRGRLHSRPAPLGPGFTIFELRRGNREIHFVVQDSTGTIREISAGRRPEVDFSEGCA